MANRDALLDAVAAGLREALGQRPRPEWIGELPGGDINRAALLRCGATHWFLKYHEHAPAGLFAAEATALAEIAAQGCIRVPVPVAHGTAGGTSWLLLEHLALTARGPQALLGRQLAALHRVSRDRYGWERHNYIGSTPQANTPTDDWTEFWRDRRLKPQLEMAGAKAGNGALARKGERLLQNIDRIMGGHQPAPALLHGDLWAGNTAFTGDGQPVLFDPASYYGDRETDIAMSELFGGFSADFYAAYREHFPLPEAYRLRRGLYNLYHLLNHLNLFGEGYLPRCLDTIERLLAETG